MPMGRPPADASAAALSMDTSRPGETKGAIMTKLLTAALMLVAMMATAQADRRIWAVNSETGERTPYLCSTDFFHDGFCRKDWDTIKRLVRKHRREPEVRSWRLEDIEVQAPTPRCPDRKARVRVVGTEHHKEENARAAAEMAWKDEVRYEHGERFTNLEHAFDVRWGCTQSNTGNSLTARVAEKLVDGISVLLRCRLEATPCSVLPKEEKPR